MCRTAAEGSGQCHDRSPLEINKMVVVADAPDTRLDLFTVLGEALVLTTGRFERLLSLLQAHGVLWGPDRACQAHHPCFAGRFVAVRAAPGLR